MTTNFPSGLDSFTNPTSGDTLDSPDHAAQHADVNDAVEAIELALLDGAPLFIDDANVRLGVGTTSPTQLLDVNGTAKATLFSGSGASLTSLNASNLSSGTIPNARISGAYDGITSLTATDVYATNFVALQTSGAALTVRDTNTADASGYIAFQDSASTQLGYIGYGNNDDIHIKNENTGGAIYFATQNVWRAEFTTAGHFEPYVDSAYNLGSDTVRWANVYADTFTGSGSGLTALNASNLTTGTLPNGRFSGAYSGITTMTLDVISMSNEIQGGNGSASDPTYTFTSDGDTGMYWVTTNQLGFTAGNSTGLVVASGTVITADPATSSTSGYQYVLRNNTFGTLYRFTSSADLKENIATFDDSGDIIDALRPVTFVPRFIPRQPTPDDQHDEFDPTVETDAQRAMREADIQHGFIAEEVASVANGVLGQYEWTEDGQLKPTGWRWPDMIAVLVAEVKSLRARVATLESV